MQYPGLGAEAAKGWAAGTSEKSESLACSESRAKACQLVLAGISSSLARLNLWGVGQHKLEQVVMAIAKLVVAHPASPAWPGVSIGVSNNSTDKLDHVQTTLNYLSFQEYFQVELKNRKTFQFLTDQSKSEKHNPIFAAVILQCEWLLHCCSNASMSSLAKR